MINSFENYLKLGKAKRKTPDAEEAKALFKQSEERMEYTKAKDINKTSAKFILQDSYEAVREAAQSLMSIKGFKPYSHEATISFIKQFYSQTFNEEEIYSFDRFRKLRNDSVYKAILVEEGDAKSSILFAKKFILKIQPLLKTKKTTQIIYNKDRNKLAEKAIEIISNAVNRLKEKNHVILGIPGGRSVKEIFESFKTAELPWDKIHIFWVDERMVPLDDPESNYKLAFDSFISELIAKKKIRKENVHPFDIGQGVEAYNNEFRKYKKFDIIILGVGEDGHVGALYPNHSVKNDSAEYFTMDDSPKPPPDRLASSRKMLEKSDTSIALIFGEAKKDAYKGYLDSSLVVTDCPVKLINKIGNSYILTDVKEN